MPELIVDRLTDAGLYALYRPATMGGPQVDPISELLRWLGEFRYLADSATFTDCASGVRWPVAMSADYQTLERNYLQSRSAPGAPLTIAHRIQSGRNSHHQLRGLPSSHI